MPGITFNNQVLILGTREAYTLDQSAEKKKNKKKRVVRPDYTPGKLIAAKDAEKLFRYMMVKLDFKLCETMLDDAKYCTSYLKTKQLEMFIGKALISGRLEEVKKVFEKAKKKDQFKDLTVSNEYFEDMIARKKKSFSGDKEQYQSLIIMTIVKQCDHETLKFALENLSSDIQLKEAVTQDGDMIFSSWAQTREVVELTSQERLAEAVPKTKIFDTFFEFETPLTAVLKNSESMRKVDGKHSENMITLLLQHGADPMEKRFHVFKVAARYGLVNEIDLMLKHVREGAKKKPGIGGSPKMKSIYVALLSHAATENQQGVIEFVRKKIDPHNSLRTSKKMQTVGTNNKPPAFPGIIKDAVDQLVSLGKESTCTFRYRILNGIYNLMNLKMEVEEEIKRLQLLNNPDNIIIPPSNVIPDDEKTWLRKNDWERKPGSRLKVNEVVNYNAAFTALMDPKSKKLGALLNTNMNINMTGTATISDTQSQSSRSVRSVSTSSTISRSGSSKRTLIKPQLLHQWMVNILKNNDFNGESMGMVLFALGLRFYIRKPERARKKSQGAESDAGSTWAMDSVASGAETEDDEEEKFQSDAASVASDGSEASKGGFAKFKSERAASINGGGRQLRAQQRRTKPAPKKRRRSTISEAIDFFKKAGNKIGEQLSAKNSKMKSKEKVLILELAAEFGSQQILNELLNLIAPDMSKTILKCVYLATIGGKFHTHQLLLKRADDEFAAAVKEIRDVKSGSDPGPGALKKAKTNGALASSRSIRLRQKNKDKRQEFLTAVEEFFVEYEQINQLRRNEAHIKEKRAGRLQINGNNKGPMKGVRKSITQAMDTGANTIRKIRKSISEFANGTLGMGSKTSKAANRNANDFKINFDQDRKKSLRQSIFGGMTSAKDKIKDQMKTRLKGSASQSSSSTTKKGKKKTKDVATKLMEKKKQEFMNSRMSKQVDAESIPDPIDELKSEYSRFLVAMLEQACLYARFDLAETAMKNDNIDKTECRVRVVNLLKKVCGPQKRKTTTDRELNGLIELIANQMPKELRDLPQVGRDILEAGTSQETEDINNLSYCMQKLTFYNKKPFLKQDDLMSVLNRVVEGGHKDWAKWPEVIHLVFNNMSPKQQENIEEIQAKIKKQKLTSKLPKPVSHTIREICSNGRRGSTSTFGSDNSGRRRTSSVASKLLDKFRKGSGKVRRSFSGRRSFSKSLNGSFSSKGKR